MALVLGVASVAAACVPNVDTTNFKVKTLSGTNATTGSAGTLLRAVGTNIERAWPYQVKLFIGGAFDQSTPDLKKRCGETGIPQVVATATYGPDPKVINAYGQNQFDQPFVLVAQPENGPAPLHGPAHFCAVPVWNKTGGDLSGLFANFYVYSPFTVAPVVDVI